MKPKVDPFGPENILGFVTGPYTGTLIPAGARYEVVAKSPITAAGAMPIPAVLLALILNLPVLMRVLHRHFSKPVMCSSMKVKRKIKDAGYLWGKDAYYTEETLEKEYGKNARVNCIGPAERNYL